MLVIEVGVKFRTVSVKCANMTRIESWSKNPGALSRNRHNLCFISDYHIHTYAFYANVHVQTSPYLPNQCCVTPWTSNTLHTTLNGGKVVAMLVIEVGVEFRTVSVKCANIFDQDCRPERSTKFN
jgi:hypothetical protein